MMRLKNINLAIPCVLIAVILFTADIAFAGILVASPQYNYRVAKVNISSRGGYYNNRSATTRRSRSNLLSTRVASKFNPLRNTKRSRRAVSKSEAPILNYIKAQRKYQLTLYRWRLKQQKARTTKTRYALKSKREGKRSSSPGHSKFGKKFKFTFFSKGGSSKDPEIYSSNGKHKGGKKPSLWQRIKMIFVG